MTNGKKLLIIPVAALLLAGGAVAGYASMASAAGGTAMGMHQNKVPHVGGAITAISGNTITVSGFAQGQVATTYTVDATNATFVKDGKTATIGSFVVGDKISVQGTVNGTSVVATKITNGFGRGFGGMGKGKMGEGKGGVMGKVTAVNGSTITITRPNGKTFTVNAGSATVQKVVTGTLSDVSVGDSIGVRGSVSGDTVTATSIMDGVPAFGTK